MNRKGIIITSTVVVAILAISTIYLSSRSQQSSLDAVNETANDSEIVYPATPPGQATEPVNKPDVNASIMAESSPNGGRQSSTTSAGSEGLRFEGKSPLRTENSLLVQSAEQGEEFERIWLDGSSARAILTDEEQFDRAMEAFSSDEAGSTDAMELTDAYRAVFGEFGKGNQADALFELQGLSCGYALCLGWARTQQSDATWSAFLDYFNATTTGQVLTFSEYAALIGDEVVEHRFLFSIDPAIVGTTVVGLGG